MTGSPWRDYLRARLPRSGETHSAGKGHLARAMATSMVRLSCYNFATDTVWFSDYPTIPQQATAYASLW